MRCPDVCKTLLLETPVSQAWCPADGNSFHGWIVTEETPGSSAVEDLQLPCSPTMLRWPRGGAP